MNMPNFASCHHCMRRVRSATVDVVGAPESAGRACCAPAKLILVDEAASAPPAAVPINAKYFRLFILLNFHFPFLLKTR